jgi:hypothetical protein
MAGSSGLFADKQQP